MVELVKSDRKQMKGQRTELFPSSLLRQDKRDVWKEVRTYERQEGHRDGVKDFRKDGQLQLRK